VSGLSAWRDLPTTLDGVALSHRVRAGGAPILMVHGVGPGTNGRTNFGPLLDRLAPRFALHLIDLAGFGDSGRKATPPFFDVSFWLRQIGLAIDRIISLHARPPLLIGNSVGGALALKAAAARPDLKQVLVIGAPAGASAPPALRAFWTAPRDAAELAASMRPMTAAAAEPGPALVLERLQPFLQGDYGDYFDAMLADPDDCLRAAMLTKPEAMQLRAHVTLLHGRQDRACLASATLGDLMPLLPEADLIMLGGCGHNAIAERTADVLSTIDRLVEKNDQQ
jgi:pimeloyl-ACP methyl ester carboxylesterase